MNISNIGFNSIIGDTGVNPWISGITTGLAIVGASALTTIKNNPLPTTSEVLNTAVKNGHFRATQIALLLCSPSQAAKDQALITAAEKGNAQLVRLLLTHGAAANATVNFSITPILAAIHRNCPQVIRQILEARAPQDQVESALRTACMLGKRESVEAIFASTTVSQHLLNNLLRISYHSDSPAITRALLDHGAVVDAVNERGAPLHIASNRGRAETMQVLLEYGANTEIRDYQGRTSLDVAHPGVRLHLPPSPIGVAEESDNEEPDEYDELRAFPILEDELERVRRDDFKHAPNV